MNDMSVYSQRKERFKSCKTLKFPTKSSCEIEKANKLQMFFNIFYIVKRD